MELNETRSPGERAWGRIRPSLGAARLRSNGTGYAEQDSWASPRPTGHQSRMNASTHPARGSHRSHSRSSRIHRNTGGAESSPPLQWLVRAGFVARAITYAVIAALALALALGIGIRPASANPQGALALIVGAPLGRLAVGVMSAALLAYALWKLALALRGRGPEGGGGPAAWDRLTNLGGGLVYVVFFGVSVAVLTGSAGNGADQPQHAAAQVLGLPAGE